MKKESISVLKPRNVNRTEKIKSPKKNGAKMEKAVVSPRDRKKAKIVDDQQVDVSAMLKNLKHKKSVIVDESKTEDCVKIDENETKKCSDHAANKMAAKRKVRDETRVRVTKKLKTRMEEDVSTTKDQENVVEINFAKKTPKLADEPSIKSLKKGKSKVMKSKTIENVDDLKLTKKRAKESIMKAQTEEAVTITKDQENVVEAKSSKKTPKLSVEPSTKSSKKGKSKVMTSETIENVGDLKLTKKRVKESILKTQTEEVVPTTMDQENVVEAKSAKENLKLAEKPSTKSSKKRKIEVMTSKTIENVGDLKLTKKRGKESILKTQTEEAVPTTKDQENVVKTKSVKKASKLEDEASTKALKKRKSEIKTSKTIENVGDLKLTKKRVKESISKTQTEEVVPTTKDQETIVKANSANETPKLANKPSTKPPRQRKSKITMRKTIENVGDLKLTKKRVKESIRAIQKLLEKQQESKKSLLPIEDAPLLLQIECVKVPKIPRMKIRPYLPHKLAQPSDDICLFVQDLKKGRRRDYEPTVEHWETLLGEKGVDCVKEIIPMNRLKTEYSQFEMQRKLAMSFDYFLADGKIVGHLTHLLGQGFFKRQTAPTPIKLGRDNLKKEFDFALHKTCMTIHPYGNSHTVRVGTMAMEETKLAENIWAACEVLAKEYPGGWRNIRCVRVKTSFGPAVPIYLSLVSKNDVPVPVVKPKRPRAYETVKGELTTVPGGAVVRLTPEGKVHVKRLKDYGDPEEEDDNDSDEQESEGENDKTKEDEEEEEEEE